MFFFYLRIRRIKLGEKQYMEAFNSELDAFKERITKRAKEKLQKAMEEYEEVEYFTMGTDKSLFYLFMIWIWIMI